MNDVDRFHLVMDAEWLLAHGAERVSVVALEQASNARNPLFEALERRIGPNQRRL